MLAVADGTPAGTPELFRPDLGSGWPIRITPAGSYYYGVPVTMNDIYTATLDATMSKLAAPAVQAAQRLVGCVECRVEACDVDHDGNGRLFRHLRDLQLSSEGTEPAAHTCHDQMTRLECQRRMTGVDHPRARDGNAEPSVVTKRLAGLMSR